MRMVIVVVLTLICLRAAFANEKADLILNNITNNPQQSVLHGTAKNIIITRGPVSFKLNGGDLTLYDLGAGRICAMTFIGQGEFTYIPPDDIEKQQLRKFSKCDTLQGAFKDGSFLFTVELNPPLDTTMLQRDLASADSWEKLHDSLDRIFKHLGINASNSVIGDLISTGPGTFFSATFELVGSDNYVFIEDPLGGDQFSLFRLFTKSNNDDADIIGCFTPDGTLQSQRGVAPIDIMHYDLDSKIESNGDMKVISKIVFTPMTWGREYIRFNMYGENKINYILDSAGDTLEVIKRIDKGGVFKSGYHEHSFGVILEKPLEIGIKDSLEIVYEGKSLKNFAGNYLDYGMTSWYPQNNIRDLATYSMKFDFPKNMDVICCGNMVSSNIENGRKISSWEMPSPVSYVSFSFGLFKSKEFDVANYAPVKIFISETIPHQDLALYLAYFGELSSSNMIGRVGADVTNSLIFYTSIFGPCPFDTVRAVESYTIGEGQGSPGLIHLSWDTFQMDDIGGRDEMFRSHEVAHQWWGHIVDNESYRDTWITEGLAEYCGYWFYQLSSKNTKVCNETLNRWQKLLIEGDGLDMKGSAAGAPVLGIRLNSTKSDDYGLVVYEKGAYIFHMIRYLMHDYKTGSDDSFAAFLKDMTVKFKNKPITTERLRALLEQHVDGEMEWFFNQWVYGTDIPEYKVKVEYTDLPDGKYGAKCHIKQLNVSSDFQMMVPVTVLFDDDKYIHLKVMVDQPEMDVDFPHFPYKPKKVIFNSFNAVLCKVNYEK